MLNKGGYFIFIMAGIEPHLIAHIRKSKRYKCGYIATFVNTIYKGGYFW